MRILIVHSHYSSKVPSGENIAVHQHFDALADAGFEVMLLSRDTDYEAKRLLFSLRSVTHAITGLDTGGVMAEVKRYSPDIVNVHNLSPNFGTRWIKKLGVPAVLTLHNFRFTCANGLLFRDGRICTRCVVGSSFNATKYGCFQHSRLKSLPWSLGEAVGSSLGSNLEAFGMLIAQTARVKEILQAIGVSSSRIAYIPGFVEAVHQAVTQPPVKPKFIFVGRNTPEKGLADLLQIWPDEFALDVVGTEQSDPADGRYSSRVSYRGLKTRNWVRSHFPYYSGLVFPGESFEGAIPLVVREALEAGVPVLASEGSAAEPVIMSGASGSVFRARDKSSLESAIRLVRDHGLAFRHAARRQYESEMTEAAWQDRMRTLYEAVPLAPSP